MSCASLEGLWKGFGRSDTKAKPNRTRRVCVCWGRGVGKVVVIEAIPNESSCGNAEYEVPVRHVTHVEKVIR